MITKNAALCMESLEEAELGFRVHEPDSDTVLELAFAGSDGGPQLRFIIAFDDDDEAITVRCLDYVSYPSELTEDILDLCDECNSTYRFTKFYTDRDNNSIDVQSTSFVETENVVGIMHGLLQMMIHSLTDEYPKFMKAIWNRD